MKRKRKGKIMSFNNVKFKIGCGSKAYVLSISQNEKGDNEFALIRPSGNYVKATDWALGLVPHDYHGEVIKDWVHPLLGDGDGLVTLIELAKRYRLEAMRKVKA